MSVLLKNVNIAGAFSKTDDPWGNIGLGHVLIDDGKIVEIYSLEKKNKLESAVKLPFGLSAKNVLDLKGCLLTPGLIDCHSHLVWAGNRAFEFEKKLMGISYEEISRAGGGIQASIDALRKTSLNDLIKQSQTRLSNLIYEGVTTLEIKTGYGLDLKNEVKMLDAADQLAKNNKIRIVKTCLAAHTCPKEFQGNYDNFLNYIIHGILPVIKNRISAVDIFCDNIAFQSNHMTDLFSVAKKLKLNCKLHANQLSQTRVIPIAAKFNPLSADHLEYNNEKDVASMAKSQMTAVLLPGAYYYLNNKAKPYPTPPIDLFRKHNVRMAVATDLNPGSSPISSIRTVMTMACLEFGLRLDEVFSAVTINAAYALGLQDKIGSISEGMNADLIVWQNSHPRELAYQIGNRALIMRIINGEISHDFR